MVHSNLAFLVWPFSLLLAYTRELLAKDIISLTQIYLPKHSEPTDSFIRGPPAAAKSLKKFTGSTQVQPTNIILYSHFNQDTGMG